MTSVLDRLTHWRTGVRHRYALLAVSLLACSGGRPAGTVAAPSTVTPPAPVVAQAVVPEGPPLVRLFANALKALGGGDLPRHIDYLERADALVPTHPTLLLYLARARLRTGDSTGAEAALARLAEVGVMRPLAQDSVLGQWLTATGPRRVLLTQLAERAAPVIRSDTAVVLNRPDLLVESIALAPARDGGPGWIAGSMGTGAILRVDRDGSTLPLVPGADDRQPIGLKLDAHGTLWVAMRYPARPSAAGATPDDAAGGSPQAQGERVPRDSATLLQIDVATGRIIRRISSPRDGRAHVFNDLTIAASGALWLTDIESSQVFHLAPGSDALLALPVPHAAFSAPNGIALSTDERRLYVAHMEGITVWDRSTGRATRLTHPRAVPLLGIDGLYACRDGLVAIQALPDFTRVLWLQLDASGSGVLAGEILEQRHPAHDAPTTGVLDGDTLHYVASSEVRRFRPDGSIAPATRPSATVLLRLPLGGRCG